MASNFEEAYEEAQKRRNRPAPTPGPGNFGPAYDRARRRSTTRPLTTPSAPPGTPTMGPGSPGYVSINGEPEKPGMDMVSWVIDMLSRGAYASKQIASNTVDEHIETLKKINAPGGVDAVDMLAGMFNTWGRNAVGPDSYANAFWGNEKERKELGADLIEQSTDKYGAAFNPNYVNRVDNVEPLWKGAGGLAFDIFADATTYIPGALMAKTISAPFKLGYHGGAALPKTILGKPLPIPEAVRNIPGARALGYKSVKDMRAYDAQMAAWRAEGKVRAAANLPPTPGATVAANTVNNVIPGAKAAPPPRGPNAAGAPGVAQRAQPVAPRNPFGRAMNYVGNVTQTAHGKVAQAVNRAFTRTVSKQAPGAVAPAAKTTTAFNATADAEADVQRATVSAQEEAHEATAAENLKRTKAKVEATATERAMETARNDPQRQAKLLEAAQRMEERDLAEATARQQARKAAEGTSLDERLIAQQKEAGGAIPIPDSRKPQATLAEGERAETSPGFNLDLEEALPGAPLVVNREPLPEGALTDLNTVLTTGRNVKADGSPVFGWQANTLVKHSGTPLASKDVKTLLEREGGTGKPLTSAEATVLDNIRYDAALGLREASEAKRIKDAVVAADKLPHEKVEAAGPYISITGLHNILKNSPFIERSREFIKSLTAGVVKQNKVPAEFQGTLRGTYTYTDDDLLVGTGIFLPEHAELRDDAMRFWVSEEGGFNTVWGEYDFLLRDGTEVTMSAKDVRDLISRLDGDENATILMDAATGREFIGPPGINELDGMKIEAVWKLFYDDLNLGSIQAHGAAEAVQVASAFDALKVMLETDVKAVERALGEETTAALRVTMGQSDERLRNHFEVLVSVSEGGLTVDQLKNVIRLGSMYNIPGSTRNIMHPVFEDLGQLDKYTQAKKHYELRTAFKKTDPKGYAAWLAAKKAEEAAARGVDNAVETPLPKRPPQEGQVPTPPEAIPPGVDPVEGAAIASSPSSVVTEPAGGPQALLNMLRDAKGKADLNDEDVLVHAAVESLVRTFDEDVLKPQGLSLTTESGVKVDKTGPDSRGWRTQLWNMPKQVEFAMKFHDILLKYAPRLLEIEGGKYRGWKPGAPDEVAGKNGIMGLDAQIAYEDQMFLRMLQAGDKFLSSLGIKQVIGTTKKDAIPLSLGDIVASVHHWTGPKGVFGSKGTKVRQIMLTGGVRPGAGKVNWSNLMEAWRLRLNGKPREQVKAALLGDRLPGKRGKLTTPTSEEMQKAGHFEVGQNPNNWNNPRFHKGVRTYIFDKAKPGEPEPWLDIFPNATFTENPGKRGHFMDIPGDDMAEAMLKLMDDRIAEDLGNVAINNGWRGKNTAMKGKDIIIPHLSGEVMTDLVSHPEKMPQLIRHLATLDETAETVARANHLPVESGQMAVEEAAAKFGPDVVEEAKADVRIAEAQTPGAGARQNAAENRAAIETEQRKQFEEIHNGAFEIADDAKAEYLSEPGIRATLDEPLEEDLAAFVDIDNVPEPVPAPTLATGLSTTPAGGGGRGTRPPKTPKGGGRGGKGGPPKQPPNQPPATGPGSPGHVAAANGLAEEMDLACPHVNEYLNGVGKFLFNSGKHFNASLGMKTLWPALHSSGVLANSYLAKVTDDLTGMLREHGKPAMDAAFEAIRTGNTAGIDQRLLDGLNDKLNLLWSTQGDSVLGNALLAHDPVVEHLNGMLGKYFNASGPNGVIKFDLDAATKAMKKNSNLTLGDALAVQWRAWPVADSADFIQRLMSAAVNVAEHRSVVNAFDVNVAKWGGSSDVYIDGWAKPKASGPSSFIHFIDQDKFYPRELLAELSHADAFATTSRQIEGKIGDFLRKSYIPALNAWKRGLTVNQPGHHVRTQLGDMCLTFSARGNDKSFEAVSDATRIFAMRKSYEDLDFLAMLNNLHKEPVPGAGPRQMAARMKDPNAIPQADEVLFTGHLPNGTEVDVTIQMSSDYLHTRGLKPTYITGEGLYDDTELAGRVAKWAKAVSFENTWYGKMMGSFSQGRDHWTRAQHFQQIMRQEMGRGTWRKEFAGKWNTVDELADLAAKEVKRWHPDSSMLTGREASTLRLIIPFYSWMSKIMPAFFESFLRHPGRVSMFPKASYNWAVASGVNPDSIYDPFPVDQAFPSYMEGRAFGPAIPRPSGRIHGHQPRYPTDGHTQPVPRPQRADRSPRRCAEAAPGHRLRDDPAGEVPDGVADAIADRRCRNQGHLRLHRPADPRWLVLRRCHWNLAVGHGDRRGAVGR